MEKKKQEQKQEQKAKIPAWIEELRSSQSPPQSPPQSSAQSPERWEGSHSVTFFRSGSADIYLFVGVVDSGGDISPEAVGRAIKSGKVICATNIQASDPSSRWAQLPLGFYSEAICGFRLLACARIEDDYVGVGGVIAIDRAKKKDIRAQKARSGQVWE